MEQFHVTSEHSRDIVTFYLASNSRRKTLYPYGSRKLIFDYSILLSSELTIQAFSNTLNYHLRYATIGFNKRSYFVRLSTFEN